MVESMEPEVEAFMGKLKMFDMLSKSHKFSSIKRRRSASAHEMTDDQQPSPSLSESTIDSQVRKALNVRAIDAIQFFNE